MNRNNTKNSITVSVTHSEPCQTPKKELCKNIITAKMPLTVFIKSSILDVALKSDYSICILITTLRFLGKIEIGT